MKRAVKSVLRKMFYAALMQLSAETRIKIKNRSELKFWSNHFKGIANQNDVIRERSHYEHFFTTFFALTKEDYDGKAVLDIGCGPLGSLEWADNSAKRVGLDPLAGEYQKLSTQRHSMTYVEAPSERIPFEDKAFDFVTTLNSLDHVNDVDQTVREMKRVLKDTGKILIITEIFHEPTINEPHRLKDDLAESYFPEYRTFFRSLCGVREDHDLYRSLTEQTPQKPGHVGILCLGLERAVVPPS